MNAEFQTIAGRDKKAALSEQGKEREENNRMGKTRDFLKKTGDTKGTFHAKMGTIKDRNSVDLIETEEIKKRWQKRLRVQWTGSKLGKEYAKAVYHHPAYLTSVQSTSCDASLDDSQGGIKIARRNINLRYADDTTLNGRKWRGTKRASWWE